MKRSTIIRSRLCVLFVIIILMSGLLTGCWNRRELNELSVVLALGIDSVDGQYEVSVQVADPSQLSQNRSSQRARTIVFSKKAATIFEALRKLTTGSSRKMYLAHIRLVIFDEQTAKKGIKVPLDFLFRDHEIRPDFYMAVVKDSSAKDVISLVAPTEFLSANDLYRSLKVSEKAWAPTAAVNVKDMLQWLTKTGIEPVLTGIKLVGDVPKGKTSDNVKNPIPMSNFRFFGIGMLRDDRLVGWLDENESKAYNYITNKVRNTVGKVSCPRKEGLFVVEITQSKVNIIPSIHRGERSVLLKATIEANVGEVGCSMDLKDENSLFEMEKAAKEELRGILEQGVRKAQSTGTDIFGFGEAFHQKYPRQWSEWAEGWNQSFMRLPVEIELNYKLRKIGKIISPFGNNPQED